MASQSSSIKVKRLCWLEWDNCERLQKDEAKLTSGKDSYQDIKLSLAFFKGRSANGVLKFINRVHEQAKLFLPELQLL